MEEHLTYRGRTITAADLATIRSFLAATPRLSRRGLSFAVCDAWHWQQPNGTPCDAICRGLLLWLQRKERRQMMDGVVPVRLVV